MTKFNFLSVVLLAVLVSCQRFPTKGELVRFSAVARESAETKTVYEERITGSTHQNILWAAGDAVTIYSSNTSVAATEGGGSSATYSLQIDQNNETLADLGQSAGLRWDEAGSVIFYGVYPSGTISPAMGQFSMTIPESQSHDIGAETLSGGYMVAKTSVSGGDRDVVMDFYPVFTTFEIHLKNQENTTLTLQSFAIKSQNSYLTGTYVTDWTGTDRTYAPDASLSSKQAVYYFPTGTTITDIEGVDFNLFLLPSNQPFNDLSLEIVYQNESGDYRTRTLDLKINNSFVSFAACRKHVINGLAVDSRDMWTMEVDGTVLPWQGYDQVIMEEVSIPGKVSIDGAIESTSEWIGTVSAPGAPGSDGKGNHYADGNWIEYGQTGYGTGGTYNKNYQIRTLNKDLPSAQRFFTITFTPAAPTGGYWQLLPQYKEGDNQSPGHFRFERDLPDGSVSDQLTGQILNRQETIRIYPADWDPSDINTYDVWFICLFSTSPSFSHTINADSEFQDIHSDGRFSYWVFRLAQYNAIYDE